MIYLMNLEYMRRRKENVGGANVSSYIPMTCRATNTNTPPSRVAFRRVVNLLRVPLFGEMPLFGEIFHTE